MMKYTTNLPRRWRKGTVMHRSTYGCGPIVSSGAKSANSLSIAMFRSKVVRFYVLASERDALHFAEIR